MTLTGFDSRDMTRLTSLQSLHMLSVKTLFFYSVDVGIRTASLLGGEHVILH